MRVLDLFSGLGGWSQAWLDRGHAVERVDLDPKFIDVPHTTISDVLTVDLTGRFDVVLASPPCERFSLLTIGRNWFPDERPRTVEAAAALELVRRTRHRVVADIDPAYFVFENPTAKLRKLDALRGLDLRRITYCRYGHDDRKSTDLWGGFPPSLVLHPACLLHHTAEIEGRTWVVDHEGSPCHIHAPRGSRTGIQGEYRGKRADRAALRSLVPYQLSLAVCLAAEADHAAGRTWRDVPAGRLFA